MEKIITVDIDVATKKVTVFLNIFDSYCCTFQLFISFHIIFLYLPFVVLEEGFLYNSE